MIQSHHIIITVPLLASVYLFSIYLLFVLLARRAVD